MEKTQSSDRMETLRQLQDLDKRLLGLMRIREAEPRRLKETEDRVAAQEARLKDLDTRHSQYQRDISKRELEIRSHQEKINRLKEQLLKAGTNKEYQALINEISLEEAEKGRIEDKVLEMMIGVEQYTKEENEIKAALGTAKQAAGQLRTEVEAGLSEVKKREAELAAQRKDVAAKLDPETLKRYEGLLRSRTGEAVVAAIFQAGTGGEEGQYMCQGCFMPLTHQMVNQLMLGIDLVGCKSCGRILYLTARDGKE
jgi:hypothetical protein